jgi:hypothetical protein
VRNVASCLEGRIQTAYEVAREMFEPKGDDVINHYRIAHTYGTEESCGVKLWPGTAERVGDARNV